MRRTNGPDGKDIIYGLSTDTKPTDTSIDIGTRFIETNTGKQWLYTDSATWTEDLTLIYALAQVIS